MTILQLKKMEFAIFVHSKTWPYWTHWQF